MKTTILTLTLMLTPAALLAQGFMNYGNQPVIPNYTQQSQPQQPAIVPGRGTTFLGPITQDAYGPGLNSDSTGRPFTWRTQQGEQVFGPVNPNGYGMGVGSDQYGRPVQATPWP